MFSISSFSSYSLNKTQHGVAPFNWTQPILLYLNYICFPSNHIKDLYRFDWIELNWISVANNIWNKKSSHCEKDFYFHTYTHSRTYARNQANGELIDNHIKFTLHLHHSRFLHISNDVAMYLACDLYWEFSIRLQCIDYDMK